MGRLVFQAEDGIRDRSPSRGLGDVYKRQTQSLFSRIIKESLSIELWVPMDHLHVYEIVLMKDPQLISKRNH